MKPWYGVSMVTNKNRYRTAAFACINGWVDVLALQFMVQSGEGLGEACLADDGVHVAWCEWRHGEKCWTIFIGDNNVSARAPKAGWRYHGVAVGTLDGTWGIWVLCRDNDKPSCNAPYEQNDPTTYHNVVTVQLGNSRSDSTNSGSTKDPETCAGNTHRSHAQLFNAMLQKHGDDCPDISAEDVAAAGILLLKDHTYYTAYGDFCAKLGNVEKAYYDVDTKRWVDLNGVPGKAYTGQTITV